MKLFTIIMLLLATPPAVKATYDIVEDGLFMRHKSSRVYGATSRSSLFEAAFGRR